MNQVVAHQTQAPATKRDRIEVMDAVPLLDTSRFEHMQRVATVMARSTLMPDSLWKEGTKDNKTPLPYEQIISNCFLVVNQAVRWGLDPFAVAQCVSVVHGKLCYEGKLVAAVLDAKMSIKLHHHFVGEGDAMRIYLSDKPITEEVIATLRPNGRRSDMRLFDGSVGDWKTSGAGTPWTPKNYPRMLIYRGTRDWCRLYEPALMLGVYTPDEMEDMEEGARMRNARNITPYVIDDPLSDEPVKRPQLAQDTQPGPQAIDEADEPHDALTGEIIEPDTGEDNPAQPVTDDLPPSSVNEGDGVAAQQPSPSNPLPADLRQHLMDFARKASKTVEDDKLDETAKIKAIDDMLINYRDAVPEADWGKLSTIKVCLQAVFAGKRTMEQSRAFIARDLLDCRVDEIGGEIGGEA